MTFLNEDDFYSVRLLTSRQTPKLEEDHSWSAVHDYLFNIFTANLHIWRPILPFATQRTRHSEEKYFLVLVGIKEFFSFFKVKFINN